MNKSNSKRSNLTSQIRNYKFLAASVVQTLYDSAFTDGDSSVAYVFVNVGAANATRKPEVVVAIPESFPGYIDYLYDDSSSTKDIIKVRLKRGTGSFATGYGVRFSVLCIWT